jgi:hypothetical protein
MAKRISLLLAVLFLFSCAQIVRNPVKYDQQKFIDSYDKMFAAAISKGTQMGYRIDRQNKEYGLINMNRKVGISTYSITVDFDEDSFTIKGEIDTDLFNPFIGEDAKVIEEAIKKAAE